MSRFAVGSGRSRTLAASVLGGLSSDEREELARLRDENAKLAQPM
jgi:hypothetical protein